MQSAKRILEEARALILSPENWTTEVYAKTSRGNSVDASDPSACQFSVSRAKKLLRQQAPNRDILYLNDTLGHAAVMKAFDAAIANANAN